MVPVLSSSDCGADAESRRGPGNPLLSYDIDIPDQEAKADKLVLKFGDWSEDYLVPQVFVETKEGIIQHVFTGYSESVDSTKRALNSFLNSPLFARCSRLPTDDAKSALKELFAITASCYGHCKELSGLEFRDDSGIGPGMSG